VRRSAVIGMLGEIDLALAHPSAATTLTVGEIAGRLAQTPIREILSEGVTAVGPRTPLTEAIRLMRARRLAGGGRWLSETAAHHVRAAPGQAGDEPLGGRRSVDAPGPARMIRRDRATGTPHPSHAGRT
jgi:hypothetical protein